MTRSIRVLAALLIASFTVGPVSAATAPNTPKAVVAATSSSAQSGSVIGSVKDDGGAPVAGATISLHGASTLSITTDAAGRFTLAAVPQGLYSAVVEKAGYTTATEDSLAVVQGQTLEISIQLHTATLTSLREIATVRANGRSSFNTTTASVAIVSSQQFQEQSQVQVGRVLNQIPGVQNSLPTSSANGAVPGAITVPNIRGGLSFETASLIDGHPLAVGDYGDYVTTFLNSFMLGSVEVIKGPGVMSPQTNYAIGGTVNFRTKDPTLVPTPDYTVGYTNHGGSYYNFGLSDTILNNRLGFVVDVAGISDPSMVHNYTTFFSPYAGNGVANWNGSSGVVLGGNSTRNNVGNTVSQVTNQYGLVACCYTYDGSYNNTSELLKLRYKLSQSTTFTASYLGGESYADQNANTSSLIPSTFIPGAGYTGSLATGTSLTVPGSVYPSAANEVNNEPIFQAEISTTMGNDTVLARYYHASIDRLIYEGNPNPAIPVVVDEQLFGTNSVTTKVNGKSVTTTNTYNGQVVPVAFFDYYNQTEEDRLTGESFQYDHPFGDGDDTAFSIDRTNASSTAYSLSAGYPGAIAGTNTLNPATIGVTPTQSVTNPAGTNQVFTTYLLRTHYLVTPKLQSTLSLYDNNYTNTFPFLCPGATGKCLLDGSNAEFTTNHTSHFDERLAFEYRAADNVSVRLSAGSAIAPPYLSLLSKVSTTPLYNAGLGAFTQSQNNSNLLPETAFGYDLGTDVRLSDNVTVVSGDLYMTNLFNHFVSETFVNGTLPNNGVQVPLYVTENTNVSNARFQGVELSIVRSPRVGFGFNLAGALQKAFPYNLPPNFYCANLPAGTPCTPANYNTNLSIIAGQNFTGNGISGVLPGGAGVTANGLSNTNIPYFQGNAELNYRTRDGIYLAFGDTFYGNNNSYNVPAFGIAYATFRVPVANTVSLQVSGDNIFNALNSHFPLQGSGTAYRLANGYLAATTANNLGPATVRFDISKTFGARPSDYNPPIAH